MNAAFIVSQEFTQVDMRINFSPTLYFLSVFDTHSDYFLFSLLYAFHMCDVQNYFLRRATNSDKTRDLLYTPHTSK